MIYHNENDSYKFTRRPYHTGSNQRASKLTKFFVSVSPLAEYILSPTQLYFSSAIYVMTRLLWNVLRLQVFPGLFRR